MSDESLANYWEGWPEAAKRYRASKQQQVDRLQTELTRLRIENDALREQVRRRDGLLYQAARAIEAFDDWWWSDEIGGDSKYVGELARLAASIRAEQST